MLEINVFVSFLIVFLFFLLFFRRNNSLPNKVLAFAFLVPGLNFINNIHILTGGIYEFPWSYFIVQVTAAFFAPLSYYYISLMTGIRHLQWYKWLLGISLLIVLYGVFVALHFGGMATAEQRTYIQRVMEGPYPTDMLLYSGLFFFHQLLYFSLNVKEVWQYRRQMKRKVSSLTTTKITYLIRFIVLLWGLSFVTVVLYTTIDTVYVEYVFLPLVMTVVFLFMVYYAFNEHVIFTSNEYREHLEHISFSESRPTMTMPDDGAAQELFLRMKDTIYERELYKNPEITIQSIAELLGIPVYRLSEAIKTSGTSFYEMIRMMRVEKAKEMLTDKNCNYTIEAIAYEVGFNSRASFYRAFKKYEGIDPSSLVR